MHRHPYEVRWRCKRACASKESVNGWLCLDFDLAFVDVRPSEEIAYLLQAKRVESRRIRMRAGRCRFCEMLVFVRANAVDERAGKRPYAQTGQRTDATAKMRGADEGERWLEGCKRARV
eukprot:745903-Pleurochrysis_carterae.AAC.2